MDGVEDLCSSISRERDELDGMSQLCDKIAEHERMRLEIYAQVGLDAAAGCLLEADAVPDGKDAELKRLRAQLNARDAEVSQLRSQLANSEAVRQQNAALLQQVDASASGARLQAAQLEDDGGRTRRERGATGSPDERADLVAEVERLRAQLSKQTAARTKAEHAADALGDKLAASVQASKFAAEECSRVRRRKDTLERELQTAQQQLSARVRPGSAGSP